MSSGDIGSHTVNISCIICTSSGQASSLIYTRGQDSYSSMMHVLTHKCIVNSFRNVEVHYIMVWNKNKWCSLFIALLVWGTMRFPVKSQGISSSYVSIVHFRIIRMHSNFCPNKMNMSASYWSSCMCFFLKNESRYMCWIMITCAS
jgi:hypothetical protein